MGLRSVLERAKQDIVARIAQPGDDLEELARAAELWLIDQVDLTNTRKKG